MPGHITSSRRKIDFLLTFFWALRAFSTGLTFSCCDLAGTCLLGLDKTDLTGAVVFGLATAVLPPFLAEVGFCTLFPPALALDAAGLAAALAGAGFLSPALAAGLADAGLAAAALGAGAGVLAEAAGLDPPAAAGAEAGFFFSAGLAAETT